ncbi:MAG: CRISPR-associated protein Cas4 [Phycisphaerales bacterium]|nr:CRISPR-associated protein Cas4 [Phycisphaerales bacterium]MCI0631506.1 CRISPR-associated protein Cas4 [Phycisphaerales bacterium]MCI0676145.1 CRISPR-associated protein Cas4 [Phycisphaerales bacterium]
MFTAAHHLPISALQHLLFCERQCALIHIERLWAENRLTIEGGLLHRKAHDPRRASGDRRKDVRSVRGLELVSNRLGVFGVADVVEFRTLVAEAAPAASSFMMNHGDAAAIEVTPIEYKRGKPKKHDADLVQLCAQALCLEEMLGMAAGGIARGAIFYGRTRRHLDVELDSSLRAKTEAATRRLHDLIGGGVTPLAKREKKCDRCSLLHLCLPDALRPRKTPVMYLREAVRESLAMA